MGELMERKFVRRRAELIAALIVAVVFFLLGMYVQRQVTEMFQKKEVTTQYIAGKLDDVGELTTQQVTYSSKQSMKQGSIPFITQKGFTMSYNATMKAGIRVEKMSVKVKKDKVVVKIPHAEVLSNQVNSESITFTDEKNAVFNWKNEEDVAEALVAAEADIQKNPTVDYKQLIQKADEHAEELIHKLLDDSVGGRTVEVQFQ